MQMGLLYLQTLPGPKVYRCKCCNVHTASHDDVELRNFSGRYGSAYLFRNVVNILLGPDEDHLLSTGLHTVRDVHCSSCNYLLGWKYDKAREDSEKYKEGKYILEKTRIVKGW